MRKCCGSSQSCLIRFLVGSSSCVAQKQRRCYAARTLKQPIFAPGYSLTLPEIPPLSEPDKRRLQLFTGKDAFDIRDRTPLEIANAIMEGCSSLEVQLSEASAQASMASDKVGERVNSFDRVFSALFDCMDELYSLCFQANGIARTLGNNHIVAYMLSAKNVGELFQRYLGDLNIYLCAKENILANYRDIDTVTLLRHHNQLAEYGGIALTAGESKKFAAIMKSTAYRQNIYELKLLYCRLASNMVFDGLTELSGLPENITGLMRIGDRDKYLVPMRKKAVDNVLKFCKSRTVRQKITKTFYGLATRSWCMTRWDNGSEIKAINNYRKDMAESLGYHSAYEASMLLRSTHTHVDKVRTSIAELKKCVLPGFRDALSGLQAVANRGSGPPHRIETCDLLFCYNKKRSEEWKMNSHGDVGCSLSYFSVGNVVEKTLNLCAQLLGIDIAQTSSSLVKPITSKGRVFGIRSCSPDSFLSTLIVDFDEGISRLRTCAEQSVIANRSLQGEALVYLKVAFDDRRNDPWRSQMLQTDEVFQIAYKLAYLVLSSVVKPCKYAELNGLANRKADIANIFPFLVAFLSIHPNYMPDLFTAKEDSSKMSSSLLEYTLGQNRFNFLYDFVMTLYACDLEAEINTSELNYIDVLWKLWPEYFTFDTPRDEFFPCQLPELFSSHVWTFMFNKILSQLAASHIIERINTLGGYEFITSIRNARTDLPKEIEFLRQGLTGNQYGLYTSRLLDKYEIATDNFDALSRLYAI